jgi:gliding motility-associated-like protein
VDTPSPKKIIAINDENVTTKGIPVTTNVIFNDSLFNDKFKDITIISDGSNGRSYVDINNDIVYVPNPDFCGMDSIIYQICSVFNCDTATLKVTVKCDSIKIANGFSPNEDGVNDRFVIEGLDKYDNHRIEVYNRWGVLVYRSTNYMNDWDGTWDGKVLPDGTYFYYIALSDGSSYVGYVDLRR